MNYHVIIAGNGKGSEEISELLKQEGISLKRGKNGRMVIKSISVKRRPRRPAMDV